MPPGLSDARGLALVFAVALLVTAPLWTDLSAPPDWGDTRDAYQQLSFYRVMHDAVRNHGEIPLWNPYFGGGIPWAGYPLSPGTSPATLAYVAFGDVAGMKLLLILYLLAGGWGTWYWLRRGLALGPFASACGGMLFVGALWSAGRAWDGNYSEHSMLLFPAAVSLSLLVLRRHAAGILLPFVFMAMLAEAKGFALYALPMAMLALWASPAVDRAAWRVALACGVPLVVGVLGSLPDLLPLVELVRSTTVDLGTISEYKRYGLWDAFLAVYDLPLKADKLRVGVGWPALPLALLAVVRRPRSAAAPLAVMAVAALVCVETVGALESAITRLPGVNVTRSLPQYWNPFLAFGAVSLAAIGLEAWPGLAVAERLRRSRAGRHAPWVLTVLLVVPPALFTAREFARIFSGDPLAYERQAFEHWRIESPGFRRRRVGDGWIQYRNLRSGVGTITWYGAGFVLPSYVQARHVVEIGPKRPGIGELDAGFREFDRVAGADCARSFPWRPDSRCASLARRVRGIRADPAWAGESYGSGEGCRVRDVAMSYVTITLAVERCDAVGLNFNHDARWRADRGAVTSDQGRLAVELPPQTSGAVHLRFVDGRFRLGVALAAGCLAVWIVGYLLWVRAGHPLVEETP